MKSGATPSVNGAQHGQLDLIAFDHSVAIWQHVTKLTAGKFTV